MMTTIKHARWATERGASARVLASLGALSLLAALAACGGSGAEPLPAESAGPSSGAAHPEMDAHAHHAHHTGLAAGEHTDLSIYNLDSSWWDQHGELRPLDSLGGRVQVVSMVYTHCAYTCPRILMDLKQVEAQTDQDVGFVLVSIDPERDTPDRLGYFAESTHLGADRWTLLGGEDDAVLELATLLGIKYRRDSDTDFSHSNSMLVLDRNGEIVFRQDGLGEDLSQMIAAIQAARG